MSKILKHVFSISSLKEVNDNFIIRNAFVDILRAAMIINLEKKERIGRCKKDVCVAIVYKE